MGLHSETNLTGPAFRPVEIRHAITSMTDEVARRAAKYAWTRVQGYMSVYFQNATGFYQHRVQLHEQQGQIYVSDGGVVYGPWLAGTGSRNRTTRFKGYAHWRRAKADLKREGPRIAQQVLREFIGRFR
jgi:hypothetical protein